MVRLLATLPLLTALATPVQAQTEAERIKAAIAEIAAEHDLTVLGWRPVPVRPDDAATVALLRPGMRVAVIGVGADGAAHTLTDDAVVLWIPSDDGGSVTTARAGRLVVLSVPDAVADPIAAMGITGAIGLRFA